MSGWQISVVGTPSTTDLSQTLDALVDDATDRELDPAIAVASLAERAARSYGTSLIDCGLRLFEGIELPTDVGADIAGLEPASLGRTYERLLSPQRRRRSGVHLTPHSVAQQLVAALDPRWVDGTGPVLDPSVGGGAFLLAAAQAQVSAGRKPVDAVGRVHGIDIDPTAVAVAEAALALWQVRHGLAPEPHPNLRVGDGLLDPLPPCDVVIGNPPFLNQLRSQSTNAGARRTQLRSRWGDLVGTYTDEAWLFLAAAVEAVVDGGQVAMVQPISVLAARHGSEIRGQIHNQSSMTGLWMSDGQVFDAAVEVCAPVLVRGAPASRVRRWAGVDFDALADLERSPAVDDWGRAGAVVLGVPSVSISGHRTVADLANATAGFRDQFYGFAPYVDEQAVDDPTTTEPSHRLVTVGMIDPFRLRWGSTPFRFAGGRYTRPVLDIESLAAQDPSLTRWVEARQRPKILVATQTRVIEAWVDEAGDAVPATPVVSLEPANPDDLWLLMAAIMAPGVAADLVASRFGTAMSVRALKVAARDIAAIPLPKNEQAWERGAEHARALSQTTLASAEVAASAAAQEFVAAMGDAYGIDSTGLASWWRTGWPIR